MYLICVLWWQHIYISIDAEHCSVQLYTPNGKCIASCKAAGKDGPPVVQRRFEELHNLPRLECTPPIQLLLGGLRIIVLLSMAICVQQQPALFVGLYWVAFLLDLLARSERETTKTVVRFALLADRMTTLVLSGAVLLLEIMRSAERGGVDLLSSVISGSGNWMMMSPAAIIIAVLLDFTSHTLCPSVEALYGPANPSSLRSSKHGELWDEQGHSSAMLSMSSLLRQDVYSTIRRFNPVLLTAICIASEYFLLHCFNQ